jgi:phage terminase small subunit
MSQSNPTDHEATRYAESFVLYGKKSKAWRNAFPTSKAKPEVISVNASKLHDHPKIQLMITELSAQVAQEAADTFQIDAAYVMKRIADIDRMDVADIIAADGSIMPVDKWPMIWRQYVSSFEVAEIEEGRGNDRQVIGMLKKIKWPDKTKNLEMMGKLAAVGAFKDLVEHSGQVGVIIAADEDGL